MDRIDITHLVPNFILGDKNGWALAKAIEAGMQMYMDKINEAIDIALDPDKMPEWRLDEVARDENIFWYDTTAPIAVKREIVKSARGIYSTLGTKAGTRHAVQDYAADAEILEWFEYGGEPAHFRIKSGSYEAAENAQSIVRSVENVKRLGAVLEGIYIDLPPMDAEIYAGLALYHGISAGYRMAEADYDRDAYALTDETDMPLVDERWMALTDLRR